jgi:hypothetical protein
MKKLGIKKETLKKANMMPFKVLAGSSGGVT